MLEMETTICSPELLSPGPATTSDGGNWARQIRYDMVDAPALACRFSVSLPEFLSLPPCSINILSTTSHISSSHV